MPNNESALADIYRHLDPKHFTGLPDDEVLGAAKQLDPKYNDRYRQLAAVANPPQGEGYAADSGQQPTLAGAAQDLGAVADVANRAAGAIPGVTPLANAGKAIVGAAHTAEQLPDAILAMGGRSDLKGITGLGKAAGALVPQTPSSVVLSALPFAGEAIGGILPAAASAGGPLAAGESADVGAAAGRAATGVQANDFAAVLKDPYLLKRAGELRAAAKTETHAEAAGNVMNQLAEKYGVKTGEEALKAIPEYASKSTPTLGNAVPFADTVHQNLGKIQELEQLKAAQSALSSTGLSAEDINRLREMRSSMGMGEVFGPTEKSDLLAGEMSPRGETSHVFAQHAPIEPYANEQGSAALAGAVPQAEAASKNPAQGLAEYLDQQLKKQTGLAAQKSQIANRIKQLEAPVAEGGAPNLQDLVSARQVMSKRLGRPMYQNPLEAPSQRTGSQNIEAIDDAIDHITQSRGPVEPVEVPGYGKVSTLSEARDIYREAKLADNLSSWSPVNNNKTPSVLRMAATFMQALNNPAKGLATAAATSPRVWASGIKAATFLRDLGASAGAGADSAGMAGAGAGVLANVGQEMSDEKK